MYSWRTIRVVCFVLLLLPIVHLAHLVSTSTLATLNPSAEAWAPEVEAYVAQDTQSALPQAPIVVIGGKRVKLWHDLARDLAPRPVLMRGLGDAIVEDLIFYYQRLVVFYQPSAVVLVPGNSEFFIRDSKSADELVSAILEMVALDAYHAPTRPFYIFAPLKTPLRPQDYPVIEAVTSRLAIMAGSNSKIVLLDGNDRLTDATGTPQARYFRSDGTALNEHGYLRLTELLRGALPSSATGVNIAADL